jgi:hypothetical protein
LEIIPTLEKDKSVRTKLVDDLKLWGVYVASV